MALTKWKTKDVKALLLTLPGVKSVATTEAGGDVDTERLIVQPLDNGDRLWVFGFITLDSGEISSPADTMIEMVEVSDGLDSSGGLNSSHSTTCAVYGAIVAALRQAGFSVVPKLDAYF